MIRSETEPSDLSPAGKHRYLSPKELILSFIYQDNNPEGLQLEGISTHHKQPQRRKMTGLRRRKERGKDTSFSELLILACPRGQILIKVMDSE